MVEEKSGAFTDLIAHCAVGGGAMRKIGRQRKASLIKPLMYGISGKLCRFGSRDRIQFEHRGYFRVDRQMLDDDPAVMFEIPTGKMQQSSTILM